MGLNPLFPYWQKAHYHPLFPSNVLPYPCRPPSPMITFRLSLHPLQCPSSSPPPAPSLPPSLSIESAMKKTHLFWQSSGYVARQRSGWERPSGSETATRRVQAAANHQCLVAMNPSYRNKSKNCNFSPKIREKHSDPWQAGEIWSLRSVPF